MKGLFITFEGIEGCGKTTQAKRLYKWLSSQGYDCIFTKEPGGTHISKKIRKILLDTKNDKLSKFAELFLYLADRAQHVEEIIKPALRDGKIVIADRFSDSTSAYQGDGRKIKKSVIHLLNEIATQNLVPDLTIVIDISPRTGLKRIKRKDRIEIEEENFHQRVRKGYLMLAKENSKRIKVFDGNLLPEELEKKVRRTVSQLLKEMR